MDRKMTSGEIAKKVGISQKAIRLYDEKGLLKPSDYSEGNYRLYDKESILVLEKIIALKHIGFTLEEIYDNLVVGKNMDIVESLNQQLDIMERKKLELEKTIDCIKGILARTDGCPDWSDVAEIARNIRQDQSADEGHYYALKHTAIQKDWYERIYESLGIAENSCVLDIGCGYGKLWRNNWRNIPGGTTINAIDMHGSWADDFEKFVIEHKAELSNNTEVSMYWGDVEMEAIWNELQNNATSEGYLINSKYNRHMRTNGYDYVIAHYLIEFISNIEVFMQRVSSVMASDGVFSCNGYQVNSEHIYWKEVLGDMKLKTAFINDKLNEEEALHKEFKSLLLEYFKTVEIISLDNSMKYENSEDVFKRLCDTYPANNKYIKENEVIIKNYFDKLLQEDEEVVVKNNTEFWRCGK